MPPQFSKCAHKLTYAEFIIRFVLLCTLYDCTLARLCTYVHAGHHELLRFHRLYLSCDRALRHVVYVPTNVLETCKQGNTSRKQIIK
jgi:hypothetical protein